MTQKYTILFDLDGTLVDTAPDLMTAHNYVMKKFGYDTKSIDIDGVYEFLKWAKSNNISMGVCTNKQEHLAVNLLKKIKVYDFFEYVAGRNTFEYCKPDPRHLTNTIEIMSGDINKSLMIGDSENDADAAKSAGIPMILLEDGYTDKKIEQIHHDHLIKDFISIEKIVSLYLND